MRGILVIQIATSFMLIGLLGLPVMAQQQTQNLNQCLELSRQLEQMVDAQKIVLNSMVKKNDAVAETLDHFADDLGGAGQKVKKSDLVSIRQSAKSFRGHTARESELVSKFALQTGMLVEKINECLQHSSNLNSAGPAMPAKAKVVQNARDSSNQTQR